jgi:hypothetical protein
MNACVVYDNYYAIPDTDGQTWYVPLQVAGKVTRAGDLADHVGATIATPNHAPQLFDPKWLYCMEESEDDDSWYIADSPLEAYRSLVQGHCLDDMEADDREQLLTSAQCCLECEKHIPDDPNDPDYGYAPYCSDRCTVQNEEAGGPGDGDWVTSDYATFYAHDGSDSFETTPDTWREDLEAHMEAEGFWPNVWYQGERGDYNLLDMNTGGYASERR